MWNRGINWRIIWSTLSKKMKNYNNRKLNVTYSYSPFLCFISVLLFSHLAFSIYLVILCYCYSATCSLVSGVAVFGRWGRCAVLTAWFSSARKNEEAPCECACAADIFSVDFSFTKKKKHFFYIVSVSVWPDTWGPQTRLCLSEISPMNPGEFHCQTPSDTNIFY